MNKTRLGTALANAVLSVPAVESTYGVDKTFGDLMTADQKENLSNSMNNLASAIIDEITTYAETTVLMASHTHTGVMTGGGISGPPVSGQTEKGTVA